MARKSLKPQLNQIRAWVRQGRTDAWIAHQLEVSASQLKDFRKRHGLDTEGEEPASDIDLRDEIEAEIEAELDADEDEGEDEDEDTTDEETTGDREDRRDRGDAEEAGRPRRRRRRGGRGRSRSRGGRKPLEATFDHGQDDGYGLWLDPAVKDDPVYKESWSDASALKVTIEADRIVLERAED